MKIKKIMVLSMTLLTGLALTACSSGSSNSASSSKVSSSKVEKKSSSSKAEKKSSNATGEPTFANNVITTKDWKIEITNHKVIPVGQKGNEYGEKPVMAFWYKFTNITNKEKSAMGAWIANLEAIQDNDKNKVNKLNVGALPDDQFLDSQSEDTKQGGTVEMAVAYELTDDVTPVKLEMKNIITDKVYGSQEFPVK